MYTNGSQGRNEVVGKGEQVVCIWQFGSEILCQCLVLVVVPFAAACIVPACIEYCLRSGNRGGRGGSPELVLASLLLLPPEEGVEPCMHGIGSPTSRGSSAAANSR